MIFIKSPCTVQLYIIVSHVSGRRATAQKGERWSVGTKPKRNPLQSAR